jgi:membrane fusion protein (multidrug efflux system)
MDAVANNLTEQRRTLQEEHNRVRLRWILMGGGVLVALVLGLWYYLTSGRYVSTDDSAIQAAQSTISSNVPGRVVELAVHDNQLVHKGDVLFRIDERPFQIAVEEAQAKLASARMQIAAAKATYRRELSNQTADTDTLTYQQHEFERQQRLLQSGISSRAQFEQVQHAVEMAQSQLASARQQVGSVLAMLGGNPDLPLDAHPAVMQAQAALDKAKLDESYTVIVAPDDGVVAKVEQLQVGDYINAAAPLFTLVSSRDIWVEANFKEDELTYMRPGQSASVSIDAYPSNRCKAHVTSLSPGTGSQFSLLPPENATGNWVKVVQRVPVRLQLDDSCGLGSGLPLHAGLSAEVEVDTQHHRSLFGGSSKAVAQRE